MRIVFLIGFLLLLKSSLAQENDATIQELKKVAIAPAPNASAIGKFGEIPVSLSTGIPSIAIPFYKYANRQNGLQLSVSLNYHAGGNKVEDMASNVGLGWALSAGGVISRTMRGRPDDELFGYINSRALPYLYTYDFDSRFTVPSTSTSTSAGICYDNSSDYTTVKNVSSNELDGECDIFQFSIGNISGKFFLRKDGSVQLISQSNVKISYSRTTISGLLYIDQFVLTDDQGCKYFFNEKEWTDAASSLGSDPPVMPSYVSSWYISKILASDKHSSIDFTYRSNGTDLVYQGAFSESYRSSYLPGSTGDYYNGTVLTQSYSNLTTYYGKHLGSISFPDGTAVSFDYNSVRLDYAGDSALTTVHIRQNDFDKRFVLQYDYFVSPTCYYGDTTCTVPIPYTSNDWYKRLKLVSVTESDGTHDLPPYSFEYNSTPLPTRNSKAQDWWGYYNGYGSKTSLPNAMPAPSYSGGILPGTNRPPVEAYAKAWILEKIYYPTGGTTNFVYELNDGYKDTIYCNIGGLRIKKTEDHDSVSGKTIVTSYAYKKTDNTSSGVMQQLPNYTFYWTTLYHPIGGGILVDFSEYFLNETATPSQSLSSFNGSPVIYTRVKVSKDSSGTPNGSSVSEFSAFASSMNYENNFPFLQRQDLDWQEGLLLRETHYTSTGTLIRSTENEYNHLEYSPSTTDTSARNLKAGLLHWDNVGTSTQNLFGARAYYLSYGRSELTKTTQKEFDSNGDSLVAVTKYYYENSNYIMPTRVIMVNSKADSIQATNKYPHDLAGQAVYDTMIARNIIGPLIEKKTINKTTGKTLQWIKNNYGVFNTDFVNIQTQQSFRRIDSAWDTNLTIHNYDANGNILDYSTPGGFTAAFIWSYSGAYPSAQVSNASFGAIAYSSFETGEKGNWDYSGTPLTDSGSVTGTKAFLLQSHDLERTGLDSSKTYLITYWLKNNGDTVNINGKGRGTLLVTKNNWKLYQMAIHGDGVVTIHGSGVIDEVRLYPQAAQMTTYTYAPLLGVTSQCDINNRISYYEYDSFGRLVLVRDADKNILKSYQYKYNETQ